MKRTPQNTAGVKRTLSEETKMLITAKCQLSDAYSLMLDAMELVFGEHKSDDIYDEIFKAISPLNALVESYILESICQKLGHLDSTEI